MKYKEAKIKYNFEGSRTEIKKRVSIINQAIKKEKIIKTHGLNTPDVIKLLKLTQYFD